MATKTLTKAAAMRMFRKRYPASRFLEVERGWEGQPLGVVALSIAAHWSGFTHALNKEGRSTDRQAETWQDPEFEDVYGDREKYRRSVR